MRHLAAPRHASVLLALLSVSAAAAAAAQLAAGRAPPDSAATRAGAAADIRQLVIGAARLGALYSLLCALSACWVFFVAARLPPGRARLLACAPVVALLLAATPWLVDRRHAAILIVPVTGMLSLSAFKVRGPGLHAAPGSRCGRARARSSRRALA